MITNIKIKRNVLIILFLGITFLYFNSGCKNDKIQDFDDSTSFARPTKIAIYFKNKPDEKELKLIFEALKRKYDVVKLDTSISSKDFKPINLQNLENSIFKLVQLTSIPIVNCSQTSCFTMMYINPKNKGSFMPNPDWYYFKIFKSFPSIEKIEILSSVNFKNQ